ncbi:hypothetical protein RD792_014345 [Penstemon davidsonii]|uniref:Cullin family profile domain-containing protein n=1 Tax=Penstemon davidsonii TaxID=160366 RepID=A0ABR0CPX8_9LAMI|nr:hypothetical protein RD792_014345 [Penstemon davidsonii]
MVLQNYGNDLYSVTKHLKEIAKAIEAAQSDMFLKELDRYWIIHLKACQIILRIMMHMERTFIPQTRHTPLRKLGLDLWTHNIIHSSKIQTRLKGILIELVELERNGKYINIVLMRAITKMLMDLGPSVYISIFELPFLDVSAEFYREESQKAVDQQCCCRVYLEIVEKRLNEEIVRVSNYLDAGSEAKIISVVAEAMFGSHMHKFVHMIIYEHLEDLGKIYNLLLKAPNGLTIMRDLMIFHIQEAGKVLITDPEILKDPFNLVQQLLDKKENLDKIIRLAFKDDSKFQIALKSSFEYFMNLNPHSHKYISLFLDGKLQNGLKDEEDIETLLDKVIVFFRYLQEKDVFQMYYKEHLAKRLISGETSFKDVDTRFILKLKSECGTQFTSEFEEMLTDIQISQDIMEGFYNALGERTSSNSKLFVRVLSPLSWPIQRISPCNLPEEIHEVCDEFKKFHHRIHPNKKLTWQTNMGTAVLVANFENESKHLEVTTYHMCILMLFNHFDRLTYQEIEQATKIPPSDLKSCLWSLTCVEGKNVLRKDPRNKDIAVDDAFYFNENFKTNLHRIKIGTVVAPEESEPERQLKRKRLDEDQNKLVTELNEKLQLWFRPNPDLVKRRIENLIEREYLGRGKTDMNLYTYLEYLLFV